MASTTVLSLRLATVCAVAAWSPHVLAQDAYAGTWTVASAVTPDWIEPTSPAPVRPAEIGAEVTFAPASVTGDETLACSGATYATVTLKAGEIFGSGIVDPALLTKAHATFSLPQSAKVLRVDCDKGVFDYHESTPDVLVLMHDNLVYTLKRKAARAR